MDKARRLGSRASSGGISLSSLLSNEIELRRIATCKFPTLRSLLDEALNTSRRERKEKSVSSAVRLLKDKFKSRT